MAEQLCWEDVEPGTEVTPLPKVATLQMLVKFAGAFGDFNPLHYQESFAPAQAVGGPIMQGQLKRAWLGQLITDWMGPQGTLRQLCCQYRGVDHARPMKTLNEPEDSQPWWCKGKVVKKYVADGEHRVDCEIWIENAKGEKTTTGSVIVALPCRVSAGT